MSRKSLMVLASLTEIAAALNVSKQAIVKRAGKQAWTSTDQVIRGGGYKYDLAEIPLSREERIKVKTHLKVAVKERQTKEYVEALQRESANEAEKIEVKTPLTEESKFLPHGESAVAGAAIGAQIHAEALAAREAGKANKEAAAAKFEALPQERKNEALAKFELLKARDSFMRRLNLTNIKTASEKFSRLYNTGTILLPDWVSEYAQRSGRLSVSWDSLKRWRKGFETAGLLGLVNGFKGSRGCTLPDDVQTYITGLITAYPAIKDKRILDACDARFSGQDLSHSAIRRFAAKFRTDNKGLLLYLSNPDAWKNQQMLALGDASEKIIALNQLWEMDSTPTDLMLIDGRHTIVGCIDVWSRRPKVLVAPTSKATNVSSLIRRCLVDWGCPPATRSERNPFEGIKTDNGSDYTAVHIDVVLDALQIHQALCPPFAPEKKPHIERFFQTLSHSLVELMPGFVGHSVADRKAIEARKSFAARLMKRGEEPIKVELTSSKLQDLLDRWINAIYMQDDHASLGMSPAAKVRSWTQPIRQIANERALDMLLMPGACTRTLGKAGIRHDRGTYIAAEFGYIDVGTELRILPDATDLGTVYCYRIDGEFLCVAQDPDRTGIDRTEIAARAKAIQNRIMREGSAALKKIARETGAAQAYEEILQHRESLIAKVVELPKRSETFTTAALEQAGIAAQVRQEQVIEPEQRRVERAALVAEMKEEGKVFELPTDRVSRMRYSRALQSRVGSGEVLSERERDWLVNYMRSAEYHAVAAVEADLAISQ